MKRDTPSDNDPISPCANTCFFAAAAVAGCGTPSPDIDCVCTNADFQFKWISCVQAECQAAELDKVNQWPAEECAAQSLSVTGKPTATTPFLPSNSNADIVNTDTIAPHSTPTEISSSGTINSNSEAKGPSATTTKSATSGTSNTPRSVNFSSNYVSKYSPNADIFSDA
ncbi:hypothetical protein B0H14DRAFT_3464099 [Mycena olivaceomarginata]|nr:hypothetical protein B0H14DRAFT_3464099 [Mycena olivaceomarginata]